MSVKKLAQYYLYFLLASGLGEEMLVDTAGIVDVLLVLVCVAASHVLAVPPLLGGEASSNHVGSLCHSRA